MLNWIGRWRFVATDQLVRRFGSGVDPTRSLNRRLEAMRDLGLVQSERVVTMVPTLHWLTVDGLRTIGASSVISKPPRVAEIVHDYQVVELACWLENARPELRLYTEREIRSWEAPNRYLTPEPVYSLTTVRAGGKQGRIYPDFVSLSPEEHVWGHEFESSVKEHGRLVRLMLAYAASPTHRGAVYYASPRTNKTVRRAAEEANRIANDRGQGCPIAVRSWPQEDIIS